jgi:hypothetical protein
MIVIKLFFSITVSVCTLDLQLRKDIFNSLFSKGLALFMVFNDENICYILVLLLNKNKKTVQSQQRGNYNSLAFAELS